MKNVIEGKTLSGVMGFQYLCRKCFAGLEGMENYCWNCGIKLNFNREIKGKVVGGKNEG